ncbi:MAG: PDZ domain-containing protein [Bacteroidota bacterium]
MNRYLQRISSVLAIVVLVSVVALAGRASEKDEKTSQRGWLGVSIQNVTGKIAKRQNLKTVDGAYVAEVVDDSPADSAGIKEGDVIVEFAGKLIDDADDLVKAVEKTAPGTKATVGYLRDGQKKSLTVVVGKVKSRRSWAGSVVFPELPKVRMFGSRTFGLQLSELNEQLGEYFGAPNNEGVLVEEVEKGSEGEKAGFKAGDVIIRAGKRSVDGVDDIMREMNKHDEGDKVEFEVLRKGTRKTLTAEVENEESFHQFRVGPGARPRMQMFKIPHGDESFEYEFHNVEPNLDRLRESLENIDHDVNNRIQREVHRNLEFNILKNLKLRSI